MYVLINSRGERPELLPKDCTGDRLEGEGELSLGDPCPRGEDAVLYDSPTRKSATRQQRDDKVERGDLRTHLPRAPPRFIGLQKAMDAANMSDSASCSV